MKSLIILIIFFQILPNITIFGQIVKKTYNRTSLGFAIIQLHSEKGLTLSNETILKTNRYVNPGLEISFTTGYKEEAKTPFAFLFFSNAIAINAYGNILDRRNKIYISCGAGYRLVFYNEILNEYANVIPDRSIYDISTTGRFMPLINLGISYSYRFFGKGGLGIRLNHQIAGMNMIITSLTATVFFEAESDKPDKE